MNIFLSTLSLIICLLALNIHSAVKSYAQMNVPMYMRRKLGMRLFLIISIITIFINAFVLIDLKWYWVSLITIFATPIIYFLSILVFESTTKANFTYVTGCSAGVIWRKLITALILAIVAACI